MRLVLHEHPGPYERFDVDAFKDNEGKTIQLILLDGSITHAEVVTAKVMPCGGVTLTLEVAPWN